MKYNFDISYVITTKNEEKNLTNLLSSIVNQKKNLFSYEIIVIDNKSTDKTKEISLSFGCKFFDVEKDSDVRNYQRNLGLIEKSQGKYLFWLDADMILSSNLTFECYEKLEKNRNIKGLYIPEVILGKDLFTISRRFERFYYNNTPIDGLRFFERKAFTEIGGFTQSWMHGPDDWDLDIRFKEKYRTDIINTKIDFFFDNDLKKKVQQGLYKNYLDYPTCIFHNETKISINKFIQKKSHYYNDFDLYIKRWGKEHPALKKQLSLYYRTFKIFFRSKDLSIKTLKNSHFYILFLVIRFYIFFKLFLKIKIK